MMNVPNSLIIDYPWPTIKKNKIQSIIILNDQKSH